MQPADSDRLWARTQRTVGIGVADVRAALLRTLRELDFEVENEQFSTVRASRGSQLGGATLSPSRMPTSLHIGFQTVGNATAVSVQIEDRWRAPIGRHYAATAAYQRVFNEVLGAIDSVLAHLDPAAAPTFPPRDEHAGQSDASAAFVDRFGRIEATLKRKSERVLDGKNANRPGRLGRANSTGASVDPVNAQVAIASPTKVARMDLATAYTMLTAGQLIAARPGRLPPAMAKQVQEVVTLLEQRLDTTMPQTMVQLQISAEQAPVITFLRQQARLRDQLPLRTLQVCDTCRLEKVINPDFIQMRERSRRMKILTGSFGAVIGTSHVSPYVLIGRLVQLNKSDPDFVCQRCQGLDAAETIITFCPRCGDRRSEAALRECQRCHLDFRTLLAPEAIWRDIADIGALATDQLADGSAPPLVGNPPAIASPDAPAWAPPAVTPEWSPPPIAPKWGPPVAGAWLPPVFSQPQLAPEAIAAAWYPDYSGRHESRYWDGQRWTDHVSDGGVLGVDEAR